MAAIGSILIGDRAFWRPGHGAAQRQREILGFLVERGPVDIVYCGADAGEFHRLAIRLADAAPTREIRCEALPPSFDPRRAAARFAALAAERAPRRVVVFSPELAWVAELVPADAAVVLDAAGPPASAEVEARLLDAARACDLTLFDDRRRMGAAVAALGAERCAWAPQPVVVADPLPPLRGEVARIGVSFGAAAVDAAALAWFHDEIWHRSEFARARGVVEVVVGGDPGDGTAALACPDFRFVGPVDRAPPFFAAVDVVVAPQTEASQAPFEAFGLARPLVITPKAAAGMPEAVAPACLMAETADDFAAALLRLLGDPAARRRCVDAGLAVARRLLTPEACFGPILDAVAGIRPLPDLAMVVPSAAPTSGDLLAQGLAHRRAGRLAQAEETFRAILARDPGHAEGLQALAVLLARTGKAAEALPLLRRVVALRPENPHLRTALATTLNALSRHAEAEEAASRVLETRPECAAALLSRARARRCLGRAAEAVADCSAGLKRRAMPELLHERGLARWALGAPGAEADLRAAAAARPAEPGWAADLARLIQWRDAAEAPLPRVALACGGDLPAAWEPVWGLPGVAAEAVAAGAEPPGDSDLVITTDAGLAARLAAAGRPVWLCGDAVEDSPYLKAFPEHGWPGWAIAEISAHLAVWVRAWRATNATTKPIAANRPEGYIPR